MNTRDRIVIGSRGSDLALWQAGWAKDRLRAAHPSLSVEVKIIRTTGDVNLDTPLAEIGDKGLFTKELENALLAGEIDAAVHSLKDMPTRLPDGLDLGAISEREDVRDAFVAHPSSPVRSLADVPQRGTIATGSLRRRSQLLALRPDLRLEGLRGNIQTRLRKLDESDWHGIILATAGLKRLGLTQWITEILPAEVILPAVGQGALGVEIRVDDDTVRDALGVIESPETRAATTAERSLLRRLEGGCQIPIGALGVVREGRLHVAAVVGSLDGRRIVRADVTGDRRNAEALGDALAEKLLADGAGDILNEIRKRL